LSYFGLENFCKIERYPELQELLSKKEKHAHCPDLIFLSSEPFPFEAKHLEEVQLLFPNSKIVLIDGEICSWYGSRMRKAPTYLKEVLRGSV
jgi:hypothetical protein